MGFFNGHRSNKGDEEGDMVIEIFATVLVMWLCHAESSQNSAILFTPQGPRASSNSDPTTSTGSNV